MLQVATDIDPVAVRVTQSNLGLNSCSEQCTVLQAEPFAADPEPLAEAGLRQQVGEFDVVVANILKPALLDLRQRLVSYLKPGGVIALSGLLDSQVQLHSALAGLHADTHSSPCSTAKLFLLLTRWQLLTTNQPCMASAM